MTPDFQIINIGDELPPLELPALSRLTLALYCGASGDHNPIHVDLDYAREVAGMPDVIAHGSLIMAWLGRLLTNWVPQDRVQRFKTRFTAPVRIGDRVTCTGKVVDKTPGRMETIKVELQAINQAGTVLATGEAEIRIQGSGP